MRLSIGPARPDETAFIAASWKQSAADTPINAALIDAGGKGDFFRRYNADVQLVLESEPLLLVARDADDPSFAYGWLAAKQTPERFALAYVYTKHHFRRMGVMRELLSRALADAPDGAQLVHCERSRFDRVFQRWGFEYAPLRAVLGEVRRSA